MSKAFKTPASLWWLIAATMALHAANIAWVLRLSERTGVPLYEMPDTGSYIACARAIAEGIPLSPAFAERVLVPSVLYVIQVLGGSPLLFLGLPLLLHVPCMLALFRLARELCGSDRAAWATTALYAIWPNLYQYATEIGTDVLHAQLMLLAVAFTVAWVRGGGRGSAAAAGCLWILAQLTRPTFFFVLPVLMVLLWPALRTAGRRAAAFVLLAVTLLAPLAFTISNHLVYGVAAPSLNKPELLRRAIIPRINAFKRNAEKPESMTKLFFEERDVFAMADPDYAAMKFYSIGPRSKEEFRESYESVIKTSNAYIEQNREWLFRSSHIGVYQQVMNAPSVYSERAPRGERRERIEMWLGRAHKAMIVLLGAGLILLAARAPAYALFTLGVAAMVLAPVIFYLWVPVRGRLPIELVALPALGIALTSRAGWCSLGAFLVVGYLPRKLLGLAEWWLLGALAIVMAGLGAAVVRGAGSRGSGDLDTSGAS